MKTLPGWQVYFTLCSPAMRKRVSQLCIEMGINIYERLGLEPGPTPIRVLRGLQGMAGLGPKMHDN